MQGYGHESEDVFNATSGFRLPAVVLFLFFGQGCFPCTTLTNLVINIRRHRFCAGRKIFQSITRSSFSKQSPSTLSRSSRRLSSNNPIWLICRHPFPLLLIISQYHTSCRMGWVFRESRMYIWKQWKKPRTRVQNLMKLGLPECRACEVAYSRKVYWRSARHASVNAAISNERLAQAGYVSILNLYESLHLCG